MESIIVFCLAGEWWGMRTFFFKKIIMQLPIHKLPHKKGKLLLGIVNIEGKLEICISLNELLGIGSFLKRQDPAARMIVMAHESLLWVSPVDRVEGIYLINTKLLQNVPSTILNTTSNFLDGILLHNDKSIGIINEIGVFDSLKKGF
ncbi:MAG: chemotaxis protein CheW [Candidatus Protochlamydia sp.]|nr:chemotaxis protein CheW [Candidatus Protochlamydia sp.]